MCRTGIIDLAGILIESTEVQHRETKCHTANFTIAKLAMLCSLRRREQCCQMWVLDDDGSADGDVSSRHSLLIRREPTSTSPGLSRM